MQTTTPHGLLTARLAAGLAFGETPLNGKENSHCSSSARLELAKKSREFLLPLRATAIFIIIYFVRTSRGAHARAAATFDVGDTDDLRRTDPRASHLGTPLPQSEGSGKLCLRQRGDVRQACPRGHNAIADRSLRPEGLGQASAGPAA